ncbi:MAG: hypothetical protein QM758_24140 [Armatimonas sp.]
MKLRISRRNILVTGITTILLAAAAWAEEQHVIGFATANVVQAGQNLQATISVNQGGVNVNVVSNPPGLVNQTVTASSGSTTATLSTNPSAPAGNYQLIATPVGGGGSYAQQVQLSSNPGF